MWSKSIPGFDTGVLVVGCSASTAGTDSSRMARSDDSPCEVAGGDDVLPPKTFIASS